MGGRSSTKHVIQWYLRANIRQGVRMGQNGSNAISCISSFQLVIWSPALHVRWDVHANMVFTTVVVTSYN